MTIATRVKTSHPHVEGHEPRYEPGGWVHWPRHEELSFQFQRLLGSVQDGAGFAWECFMTAQRIEAGCDESWCSEWMALALRTRGRAEASASRGYRETAKAAWLRATNYLLVARCFVPPSDARWSQVYQHLEDCSLHYLQALLPKGELVRFPFEDDSLIGYFLRSPACPEKTPVVLCCGGPLESKESLLVKFPSYAMSRGLSLLIVDLPGQGAALLRNNIAARHDVKTAISASMDYLLARHDTDAARIALYGDGLGAAHASRAASRDNRFAAAVCDGGAWELRERLFLRGWLSGGSEAERRPLDYDFVSEMLCPFLISKRQGDPT